MSSDLLLSVVTDIERSIAAAHDCWRQAWSSFPVGDVTPETAREVQASVQIATALLDSAGRVLADARAGSQRLRGMSRVPGAANAYRISVLYVAVEKYLLLLEDEAEDQQQLLEATRSMVSSVVAGDDAEYEVKLNVANSYRYRSEKRARLLRRRAAEVRQAADEAIR